MAAERTVLVRLKADVSAFNRGLMEAAAGVSALRKEINTTNERTAWLTQGIAAIAPALVPLGAAGVPVLAGLAAQMTVAGVAAGTLALGFDGIGGAMKALNTYQLTPTVENLTKLQQAMDKIGPDGAQFVEFLDQLQPQLTALQMDARAGMFPGMEEGITHLLTLLPQLRNIVSQVAEGLGQLSAEAGDNLAGPKFTEFFNFLENDAKPILIEMGHTVGNLADGLAAIFVDLLPEAKSFSTGLEQASKSFADWAHSLDGTEGFQHFLDYVHQSGPQVRDFIEAIGKALLALVEAAAPVGSHLLPIFTDLLNVLADIASTPLGSTLIAFASLLSLYGRFAAIGSNFTTGRWGAGFANQTAAIRTGLPTWREFGNTALHSMHSVDQLNDSFATGAQRAIQSRTAVTSWLKSVGPMAAQAALLGVVMTGLDKKMGLANTASLAFAGSLIGPWGAAAGGAVGLTLDLAAANNSLTDAQKRANVAFSQNDYATQAAALKSLVAQSKAYSDEIRDAWTPGGSHNIFTQLQQGSKALNDLFTHSNEEAAAQARQKTMQLFNSQTALLSIGRGLGQSDMQFGQPFAANSAKGISELEQVATRAQPAMDALGISLNELQAAAAKGDGSLDVLVGQIVHWTKSSDTAAGRTQAVATSLSGLDSHMVSTAQAAGELQQAMDALFGPKMGVNAARNAWLESLRALHTQLDANSKAIQGTSNAALKNQDAIRGAATNMLAYLQAMAANGASSQKVVAAYRSQRGALIQTAQQLGVSKQAVIDYLHQLGLTPKAINTLVKVNGTDTAIGQVNAVKAALAGIDRVVNVAVNVSRHVSSLIGDVTGQRRARGGPIYGPGGPTDDLIPAWLSNGEYVVNAAAASRNRALLEHINAQRFAAGGVAGSGEPDQPGDSRIRLFARAVDQFSKTVDKDKAERDKIRQQQQELTRSVRDGFRSPFLDVTSDIWTTASNPFSILKGDIRDARAFSRAERDLRRRGISAGLAAQITTLGGAQQVDALTNRQLHQLEHLFSVRQQAADAAGQLAGSVADGRQLRDANQKLHEANKTLHHMDAELKHLRAEQAKNAHHTGKAMGKELNHATGRGVRAKRR